jgi:hypothetical protein
VTGVEGLTVSSPDMGPNHRTFLSDSSLTRTQSA